MIAGHFQELVSRLTTPSVEAHWGAKTYQARNASAEASGQWVESVVASAPVAPSPPPTAYTVPSAPTATSRAARPGISATLICQEKPMGLSSGCSAWPIMPAKLWSIAGPLAPAGGSGIFDKAQISTIIEAMMVPA